MVTADKYKFVQRYIHPGVTKSCIDCRYEIREAANFFVSKMYKHRENQSLTEVLFVLKPQRF